MCFHVSGTFRDILGITCSLGLSTGKFSEGFEHGIHERKKRKNTQNNTEHEATVDQRWQKDTVIQRSPGL